MKSPAIFTIGHSSQDTASFLKLLQDNGIQVVVDVRSAPYSRYVPQFNKREIEEAVKNSGMKYIFMGDVIGGKPTDPEYLDAGSKVIYKRLAASESFQQGLNRLTRGLADGWTIVLMCAEEDPLKCHRHHLISKELELRRNIPVRHIRMDGTTVRAKDCWENHQEQKKLF